MSEKHKKVFRALNYFEHFIILVSAVTGCVLVSAFPLLVGRHCEFYNKIKHLCINCRN